MQTGASRYTDYVMPVHGFVKVNNIKTERNPSSIVAHSESNYLHSVKVTRKMSSLFDKRREFDVMYTVHYS